MNKQQTRIIVIMLAIALALAAFVMLRDRAQPAGAEHDEHTEQGEHAEEKEAAHADDGVIHFTPSQITVAGITVATAGPKHLDTFIRMPGQIALNEDRTAHVTPRAAGSVRDVSADLGQQVRKDQVLASIASADIAGQRGALTAHCGKKRSRRARIC
jgi:cobalt-zinc-cadmium efflux system membrane fusion protein